MQAPAPSAETAVSALPSWDLTDLYTSHNDPRIDRDLATCRKNVEAFRALHDTDHPEWNGPSLLQALQAFEALHCSVSRLFCYGHMIFAEDTSHPEKPVVFQKIQDEVTTLRARLMFFPVQLVRMDEELFRSLADDPLLAPYRSWLQALGEERPHTLAADLEEKLQMKAITGTQAWVRLFEETVNRLAAERDGQKLGLNALIHEMMGPDEHQRKRAFEDISHLLEGCLPLVTRITNVLARDRDMDNTWRHYTRPDGAMNLANRVSGDVVDGLVETVRKNYGDLSHRYYALKASWMGKDRLRLWDRLAPLPSSGAGRLWTWDETRTTVVQAWARVSPRLATMAEQFFTHRWIDAAPRPGKDMGAFCQLMTPDHHPYVLVNFRGHAYDVAVVAHEVGHGVHQLCSNRQSYLNAHPPLVLAETASVFGEMLVFRSLLDQATTPEARRALLARKVEDMLNTVVRQTAFYSFERKIHEARKQGELSADQVGALWLETQRASLGEAFCWEEDQHLFRSFWAYISHFVHTPFYVYAYAFGDCLVNALYGLYEKGTPGFEEAYTDFLSQGSLRTAEEAVRAFGFEGLTPAFWQQGLDVIRGYIDQLEQEG